MNKRIAKKIWKRQTLSTFTLSKGIYTHAQRLAAWRRVKVDRVLKAPWTIKALETKPDDLFFSKTFPNAVHEDLMRQEDAQFLAACEDSAAVVDTDRG